MAETDRLRRLQVGEAGHHGGRMGLGLVDERRLQRGELGIERIERVAHPEAKVGAHLVVARARGVQSSGVLADELEEPGLDVHVDVFQRRIECERAGNDLQFDLIESLQDRVTGIRTHDSLRDQHATMSP